ncbi:hypothetical protein [Microbacterium sp. CH12i]|uniref:hypothetical protein n=1 Tax=Microbacterium sp. CH12i TaxID=1479651 RepID=UPI0012690292|nr:hypothetical protein [Microbacterium sp. CH12i]
MTARYDNPLPAAESRRYADVLCRLLTSLDSEVVFAALISESKSDLLDAEREEVHRFREFLDGRVLVPFESFDLRRRALALLDAFEDESLAAGEVHGSPSIGAVDVLPSPVSDPIVGDASGAPASPAVAAPGAPSGSAS